MTAPVWLRWIDPAPKDAEELAQIEKQISDAVKHVSRYKDRPNWRASAVQMEVDAKKYRAAEKALANLPEPTASEKVILDLRHELGRFAEFYETWVKRVRGSWAPKKKGNVHDWLHTDTVILCEMILKYGGRDTSRASKASLALWVWNEALGRNHDGRLSDLKTWETTVDRARGKVLHKSNERGFELLA